MRLLLFITLAVLTACSTKKAETTSTAVDSTAVDSVLATTRANALLAYDAIPGFSANPKVAVPDSLNYFLIGSQEQLDLAFAATPGTPAPDFIINYIVGVVGQPSAYATTIAMEKVETGESSIDVYLTVTRGEKGKSTKPGQLFAIERREGYPVMQFYVNGKKDRALVLVQ